MHTQVNENLPRPTFSGMQLSYKWTRAGFKMTQSPHKQALLLVLLLRMQMDDGTEAYGFN